MISAIVDILTTLPQMVVTAVFLGRYIQAKKPWMFTGVYTLVSLCIYIVTGYVLSRAYSVRGVTNLIAQILLVYIFATIPKTHGVLCMLMGNALMFLGELAADVAAFSIEPNFADFIMMRPSWIMIFKLSFLPLVAVSFGLSCQICRRLFPVEGDPEISKYLPFLVIQTFLVIIPMFMAISFTENYTFLCLMCVGYLVANLGLDLLLMHTFRKINRAHVLELQQEQTQSMLQAQADYYHQLQNNLRTIRQLRHDMSNQLQTLSILLEKDETDLARQQLSALRETVTRTGQNRHTGNPVVDAVIESKLSACMEADIDLRCGGSLPEEVGVKADNLCSIAANLLDNAIHACGSLSPEQRAFVEFSAEVKEARIVFRCENPAPPDLQLPKGEPTLNQEHGWGLSILRNIAEAYQGDLVIQRQKDIVQSVLWLTPQPRKEGALS